MSEILEKKRSSAVISTTAIGILLSLIFVGVMTVYVVPMFIAVFDETALTLPLLTRMLVNPSIAGISFVVVALTFIPSLILQGRKAVYSVMLSSTLLIFLIILFLLALWLPMMKYSTTG